MLPTFLLQTELSVAEVLACVRQAVAERPADLEGIFAENHAMISICGPETSFLVALDESRGARHRAATGGLRTL